ncbi:MAG TPA: hypothetical protein VG411_05020, partial [Actinomycetota bacterium]|nr:hypothetical protein [Actinomycetota bacterium]
MAAATLLALVAWPLTRDDLRRLPLVPAAVLAGWALLDALLLGQPVAGAAGLALRLVGLVAVLAVCRRLGREDRDVLLTGIIGTCLVVALTGWVGVAWRVGSLAWEGDGIWRGLGHPELPERGRRRAGAGRPGRAGPPGRSAEICSAGGRGHRPAGR